MKTFFCQNAGGSNSQAYKITNGMNVKSDFAVSSNTYGQCEILKNDYLIMY